MNKLAGFLIFGLLLFPDSYLHDDFPELKGAYLGQPPPGSSAVLFAPGYLADDTHSPLGIAAAQDGKEIFYTLFSGPGKGSIVFTREINGTWTKPKTAHF